MNENYPHIRFRAAHGARMIRDGLRICFYMQHPDHEIAQAVVNSLDVYLRTVGAQTLGWYVDQEGEWCPLDEWAGETLRANLLGARVSSAILADDPSGVPDYQFEYYGKPLDTSSPVFDARRVSSVGFWLPTEFLEAEGPVRVRKLALELAALLPFSSGHAGLCFNALLGYRETEEELSRLCLRYPGMDIFELESLSTRLGARLRGPAWMTFLGQPVLDELGGLDMLRSRLVYPRTEVQQRDDGHVVVTLGDEPEAGDTQKGRILPAYRELARVLAPWLYHSNGWAYFPDDIHALWEHRFLD
ncbi:DUF3396 domain-containing protein [Stigmatella sp. ncwal1]|uniref:DUF3396 domain-containing protein n=1 Tax=Stigmatella ashevillensis TaxID=2995309 RepID=A0ABT5D9Q0_9BACT|nr:type VI immunity family protein [Stigmatella ashevillena]MDC0710408.1 DUF3396 domain-containing protein [Stigmatella ashevillena]